MARDPKQCAVRILKGKVESKGPTSWLQPRTRSRSESMVLSRSLEEMPEAAELDPFVRLSVNQHKVSDKQCPQKISKGQSKIPFHTLEKCFPSKTSALFVFIQDLQKRSPGKISVQDL